ISNTGAAPFTSDAPAAITDDLSAIADDAAYNGDVAADIGTANVTGTALTWSGPLAVGDTATITFSATVAAPDTADHDLPNTVVGAGGSNCAPASTDAQCSTDTKVRDLEITKTSDHVTAVDGEVVGYTITVENTGTAGYTVDEPATFLDDLTDVVDDATIN